MPKYWSAPAILKSVANSGLLSRAVRISRTGYSAAFFPHIRTGPGGYDAFTNTFSIFVSLAAKKMCEKYDSVSTESTPLSTPPGPAPFRSGRTAGRERRGRREQPALRAVAGAAQPDRPRAATSAGRPIRRASLGRGTGARHCGAAPRCRAWRPDPPSCRRSAPEDSGRSPSFSAARRGPEADRR